MKYPRLFGLHARPGPYLHWVLVALPFAFMICAYLISSHKMLAENPNAKLLPSVAKMAEATARLATEPDPRTGQYPFWQDTVSSLQRLGMGIVSAAIVGLLLGINMAMFPGLNSLARAFVTFLSIIPPLAVLPVLFIVFGVDETAKVILIFVGSVFVITRDIFLATLALPKEQVTKALSLGASQLGVVYRVILPQVMPRLFNTTRLTLGAAWLFLIAAEAIASTEGLGYRIYLMRRYMAMDVILPYVCWITLIGYTLDLGLRLWVGWRYPWYTK
ncbi:MAG: ABC transporter permease subunit [Nitrospinota bacterium]|nr:ABC transporter permease subunit [Nitrospinota bacterium]MDH5756681.1 ABC transporter permease subunit [Nitrospinota bacterium]